VLINASHLAHEHGTRRSLQPRFSSGAFFIAHNLTNARHSLTPRVIKHLSLYLWEEVAPIFKKNGATPGRWARILAARCVCAGYFDRLRGTSHGVATLCLPSLRSYKNNLRARFTER
jgi:hypothetical protein